MQAVWGEKWWGRKKRKLQDNLEEKRRHEENDRMAESNRLEAMRQRRIKRKMGAFKYFCWPCGRAEYDKMFPRANVSVVDPELEEAERLRKVTYILCSYIQRWKRRALYSRRAELACGSIEDERSRLSSVSMQMRFACRDPIPIQHDRLLSRPHPPMTSRTLHRINQLAEDKARLQREMEARYLNPETQEYKKFREKMDAKREKEQKQRNRKPKANNRRPVKLEKNVDDRRLRLENRRVKNGRVPTAGGAFG